MTAQSTLSGCELSIIMPVLNEASGMAAALAALAPLVSRGSQVIVADGGSTDGTTTIATAARSPAITVIHCGKGRAVQMNAGAAHATGKALLFLHADTTLPPDADGLVQRALASGQHVWGRFDVRIEGQSKWLPVVSALMNLRSRLTGIATGDQAIFMTHAAFTAMRGYAVQPLMEDIDMSQRLLQLSRPACLPQKAVTSGRRWDTRGAWRTIVLMWRLRFAYWRGTPPERLAQLYR
ncbi:MAG: TIGR04283 family arsenosugar biosynthesis glycosyltransferase [Polaromonas sp.]